MVELGAPLTRLCDYPLWRGRAYRSSTGYRHDSGTTAGDVVKYEQEELGNALGITPRQLVDLDQYPAWRLVWVGRTKKSVSRYGRPEGLNLGRSARIVAEDGTGGYLVLMGGFDN